ncbi:ParA family protein [Ornithinimicrobium sp. W1665]|uniref:ParA family protein n=1 Tax=Ornithinimicrobium sp. W1665 TaxID=3416666 RepID=UPI003D6C2D6A
MAVITLTSASGSPGVTTTALGWALSRGRPTVLVDADPTGGASMLAGYLRGQMVPPTRCWRPGRPSSRAGCGRRCRR